MQLITVPSLSTPTWVARFKRGSLFPTHLYPQAPALYRIAGPEATAARTPRTIRLYSLATRSRASPLAGSCNALKGGWPRPQAEENLRNAANKGDLATLKRLVAEGVNLEATNSVSAAPPAAPPAPSAPSPTALAARRPRCPALTAAAHRVWRRRRASAARRHGPHECG